MVYYWVYLIMFLDRFSCGPSEVDPGSIFQNVSKLHPRNGRIRY
jgi:hypothetical protein